MKRYTHFIKLMIACVAIAATSCKKDFIDINTNPNGLTNVLPEQLLGPSLVNTVSYNMLRSRTVNNELMQVTVDQGDSEGRIFRYDIRNSVGDYTWNGWYSQLVNFKDIYSVASVEPNYNETYMGISLICQSWISSLLTDTYGDVPYFQAGKARDSVIFTPRFDRQKDIYLDIFTKLEEANTRLGKGANISGGAIDPVYGGNAAKWRRFGNSLYLRLLMRLSGKTEVSAQCIAKIKEIVDTKATDYPIMASNDDAAVLRWTGTNFLTSPFVGNNIGNVRAQDFRAQPITEFFIGNLTTWNDPRIAQNRWSIAPYQGAFVGIPSGYAPGQGMVGKSYFYATDSNFPTTLMTEPLMGNIMNFSELQFLLAEAAAKGWISNAAETYYKNGVTAGITFWLPTYVFNVDTYLQGADIAWKNDATIDQKMELIHLQKYYSMFYTDFQQWFEYRRTGHPILPKGNGLRNNGVMPARLTYPVYLQSANPVNYKLAVAAQGADVISTQVWWQKP
ncbi:SusD/RagB family nutrient-binding outer membrane lipoprotein [Mucilaginibacter aquatilis]|uniref:SusD/RagB family nutrient-binding outer membrane lipoprotein n=1 Tax=Mucilaginibacter aquatilis TaxID=1517760 RepID=A0A6I4IEZ3_9SPHI|nr:SusD/RagB family nutrient-binding outer membrane lipoprotein [Mucilaginibacter aquatilis]MVN92146.1 SusD/RagB family nutrient-binding outer membrane lipoprotein [Mucilaginibacter aquatilis]